KEIAGWWHPRCPPGPRPRPSIVAPSGRWGGPRCHSRLVRGAWASTEWHSLGNLRTAQRRSGTAVDAGLLAALMTSRDRVASVILTTGGPLISEGGFLLGTGCCTTPGRGPGGARSRPPTGRHRPGGPSPRADRKNSWRQARRPGTMGARRR